MLRMIALLGFFLNQHSLAGQDFDLDPFLDFTYRFQERNIVRFGIEGTKTIALTFDDGPTNGVTEDILDTLAHYNIQAVFFINGEHAPGKEHILRRMFEEGHLVANHTTYHDNLFDSAFNSGEKLRVDLRKTHKWVKEYVKSGDPYLFRAPYGNWRSRHAGSLNSDPELSEYVGPFFWNIGGAISKRGVKHGAADWACWSGGYSLQSCLEGHINETVRYGGGVVLMHDKFGSTARLAREYVKSMLNLGYQFVRLDKVPGLIEKYR